MFFGVVNSPNTGGGSISLQNTIASATTCDDDCKVIHPKEYHHPITCHSDLSLSEDNVMSCEHSTVASGCTRTQHCLDTSVVFLIMELAYNKYAK